MTRHPLRTALLLAATTALGCGGGDKPPPYANVSGTVNYNGKPLPKGTITFAADGRPPSVIDVTDGTFSGQALTGSNKVMISARRIGGSVPVGKLPPDVIERLKYQASGSKDPGAPPPSPESAGEETLPAEWNSASKHTRVVEAGAQNKFEFDIKGK